jgi:hypothetical protein
MFIVALVTIFTLLVHPRCPRTDKWFENMCYISTMEFYPSIRKNKIMLFAGKWMEMENYLLSERRQAQKTTITCFFSYVEARPIS